MLFRSRGAAALDPQRREKLLLATLIQHPHLLELVDEELTRLPMESEAHQRLRGALLDWAHGAAERGGTLDPKALQDHLSSAGLDGVAAALGEHDMVASRNPDEAVRLWHHVADLHSVAHFQKDALAEAEKAWAEAPNEENWHKLQTLIAQLQRLGSADPETDPGRQNAGPMGTRSV